MKTILFATNCSQKQARALDYAHRISEILKASLHVLHVYDLSPIVTSNIRSREVLKQNYAAEQYEVLQKYVEMNLNAHSSNLNLSLHVERCDSISDGIQNVAQRIGSDIVLVGQDHPKSMRGLLRKDIANALIEDLQCPLLVLPNECKFRGLSTLLYASDFEESDIHALVSLVEFAEPFGAKIEIIHIPRKAELNVERNMKWFKQMVKQHISYPEIIFSGRSSEDVQTGIHEYIDEDSPEILIMMERQRTYLLERLFHRDMVKTMKNEISIPLLIFNKKSIQARLSEQFDDLKIAAMS